MSNKIFLSLFMILAALTFSGCSIKNNNVDNSNMKTEKTPKSSIESENCADCGKGGWEKMEISCNKEILNKNDFKNCLMNYNWSSVKSETSLENFKEGYIEIGSMEILDNPTANSIKVYIYNQWSVDKNGTLYLLGQLG